MQKENQQMIESLQPWFHNIHLPDGSQTAPDHFLGDFPAFKWQEISGHIPADLEGKKVLDVGCNAGFYSVELAKRGASVTAIDLDPHYLKQAAWVAAQFGLDDQIEFRQQQVYDLAHEQENYDLIWFMGVFYHLRYPLLAMDILAQKCKELIVLQSLTMPGKEALQAEEDYQINSREGMLQEGWPKMAFIEQKFNGDPTNWWAPNTAALQAMLRSCGFEVIAAPGDETFVGRKKSEGVAAGWNASEYQSATGQQWQQSLQQKVQGK